MNHPDRTYDRLIHLFERNGRTPLTPSYVAYEFDTTTERAEQMLDELVKRSRLSLDFDDQGQLYYSLPIDHEPIATASRRSNRNASAPPRGNRQRSAPQYGFDGSVGAASGPASQRQAGHDSQRQTPRPFAEPDGCDGSIAPTGLGFGERNWRESTGLSRRPARQAPDASNTARPGDRTRPRDDGSPSPEGAMMRPRDAELAVDRRADPMIAALLSVLLVGSGQLYNREVSKGLAMFVAWWILWSFAMGWIVNIWAVVDAYSVAKQRRETEPS
ncbi:MAG: hypothetical protein ACLFVJ_02885 [Persicimonas sp.]